MTLIPGSLLKFLEIDENYKSEQIHWGNQ